MEELPVAAEMQQLMDDRALIDLIAKRKLQQCKASGTNKTVKTAAVWSRQSNHRHRRRRRRRRRRRKGVAKKTVQKIRRGHWSKVFCGVTNPKHKTKTTEHANQYLAHDGTAQSVGRTPRRRITHRGQWTPTGEAPRVRSKQAFPETLGLPLPNAEGVAALQFVKTWSKTDSDVQFMADAAAEAQKKLDACIVEINRAATERPHMWTRCQRDRNWSSTGLRFRRQFSQWTSTTAVPLANAGEPSGSKHCSVASHA